MAPPMAAKASSGPLTFSLLNPIFPGDELPNTFSQNLRRPIAAPKTASTAKPSMTMHTDDEDSAGADEHEDDDRDSDADYEDGTPDPSNTSLLGRFPSTASSNHRVAAAITRVVGGRAAVPKVVSANLDSEDELIKHLKDQGVKDEVVRDRLIRDGGTKYDAKTIATRYGRIRRALDKAEQARLNEDFSDYHEDEDEHLLDAYEDTEEMFQKQLKKLEDERWKSVTAIIKNKTGKNKYSRDICRDRLETLKDGTARLPLERDPNPEERIADTNAKREHRKRVKAEGLAAAQKLVDDQLRVKTDAAAAVEEARKKKEAERAALKAKADAIKAEKEAAIGAKKLQREEIANRKAAAAAAVQQAKEDKEREKANAKVAATLAKQQEQTAKAEKAAREKLEKAEVARQEELDKLEKIRYEGELKELIHRRMRRSGASKAAIPAASRSTRATANTRSTNPASRKNTQSKAAGPSNRNGDVSDDDLDNSGLLATTPATAPPKPSKPIPKSTPKGSTISNTSYTSASSGASSSLFIPTTGSPRATMTCAALRTLLSTRNLPVSGKKDELVRRLAAHDGKLSAKQLMETLAARKLSTVGDKAHMIERIAADDAAVVEGGGVGGRRAGIAKKMMSSTVEGIAGGAEGVVGGAGGETEVEAVPGGLTFEI